MLMSADVNNELVTLTGSTQ